MVVSLFNNQLQLAVPNDTEYVTFFRTPETSDLCRNSGYANTSILIDLSYKYTSIGTKDLRCYNTSHLHEGCYDASNIVLDFIKFFDKPEPEYR